MNAKPKAAKTKKSQIKVQDMKPKKDAKGGGGGTIKPSGGGTTPLGGGTTPSGGGTSPSGGGTLPS